MMKIVYLFFCFVPLLSSDCNQSPSAKSNSNQSIAVAAENTEMKENSTFQKRFQSIKRIFVLESPKLTLKLSGSIKAATFRAGAILPGRNCCAAS